MTYRSLDLTVTNGVWSVVGANGSGKSALIEAVLWCLYGETARGAKQVRPRGTALEAWVRVTGDKDGKAFRVTRTQSKSASKSMLEVKGEGAPRDTGGTTLNQPIIDRFLGIGFRFFIGSVLFGHNSFRFTRATDSERKAIIEQVFDLERFADAKRLAGERWREATDAAVALKREAEGLEMAVALVRARADASAAEAEREAKEAYDKADAVWNAATDVYDEAVEQAQKELGPTPIADRRNAVAQLRARLDRGLALRHDATTCPTCRQSVTDAHKKRVEKEIAESNAKLEVEIKKAEAELARAEKWSQVLFDLKTKKDRAEDAWTSAGELCEGLAAERKSDREDGDVGTMAKKAAGLRKKARPLDARAAEYDFWDKGFGRRGVIGLLTDAVIAELNESLIRASLGLSQGRYGVAFDSTSALKSGGTSEKISMACFVDGEEFDYRELSNGQRQVIDVCVMFGLRDLIASRSEEVDLCVFDETMEGLDARNADAATEYILQNFTGRPVLVISHNDNVKFNTDGVIRVAFQDGQSKVMR